ncbi:MAG: hypothetical protein WB786_08690, partial [Thermoplasmata archaeon]
VPTPPRTFDRTYRPREDVGSPLPRTWDPAYRPRFLEETSAPRRHDAVPLTRTSLRGTGDQR